MKIKEVQLAQMSQASRDKRSMVKVNSKLKRMIWLDKTMQVVIQLYTSLKAAYEMWYILVKELSIGYTPAPLGYKTRYIPRGRPVLSEAN